jgi:hypothetical protein
MVNPWNVPKKTTDELEIGAKEMGVQFFFQFFSRKWVSSFSQWAKEMGVQFFSGIGAKEMGVQFFQFFQFLRF